MLYIANCIPLSNLLTRNHLSRIMILKLDAHRRKPKMEFSWSAIAQYPLGYVLGVIIRAALRVMPDGFEAGLMDGFCFDHRREG